MRDVIYIISEVCYPLKNEGLTTLIKLNVFFIVISGYIINDIGFYPRLKVNNIIKENNTY